MNKQFRVNSSGCIRDYASSEVGNLSLATLTLHFQYYKTSSSQGTLAWFCCSSAGYVHLLKIASPFLEDPLHFSQAGLKFFYEDFCD